MLFRNILILLLIVNIRGNNVNDEEIYSEINSEENLEPEEDVYYNYEENNYETDQDNNTTDILTEEEQVQNVAPLPQLIAGSPSEYPINSISQNESQVIDSVVDSDTTIAYTDPQIESVNSTLTSEDILEDITPSSDTKNNGNDTAPEYQGSTRIELRNQFNENSTSTLSSENNLQNISFSVSNDTNQEYKNSTIIEISNGFNETTTMLIQKNVTSSPIVASSTAATTNSTEEPSFFHGGFNTNYLYFLILLLPIFGILLGVLLYCKIRKKRMEEGNSKGSTRSNNRRNSTPSWVFSDPDFDEELTTLKEGE